MANFDQILKKGVKSSGNTPVDKWEQLISAVLHFLQQFNNIYNKNQDHHIAVRHVNCKKCNLASFILLVRHRNDPKQLIKYHLNDWKSINADKDEYLCGGCK